MRGGVLEAIYRDPNPGDWKTRRRIVESTGACDQGRRSRRCHPCTTTAGGARRKGETNCQRGICVGREELLGSCVLGFVGFRLWVERKEKMNSVLFWWMLDEINE